MEKIRDFFSNRVKNVKLRRVLRSLYMTGKNPQSLSNPLNRLAIKHGTDKWGDHYYTQHYHQHFSAIRGKKLNVLEIGVGGFDDPLKGGESLRMWKEYFPNSHIYSVDIHDKSAHEEDRITIFQGSQTDKEFLNQVANSIGHLDIIIDDGSHVNEHVIISFKTLFPLLDQNGIYAAEDLQTSYWPTYNGNSEDLDSLDTSMGFFKRLVDGLNYEEFALEDYRPTYEDLHIMSICFYHNMVFIQKGDNREGSRYVKETIASSLSEKK